MSYDYGYDYDMFAQEMGGEMMDVLYVFAGVLVVFGLIALVVGLMTYIFQSVGLYTIAKRRGIKNAWLAWIPVGYTWLVGCIADQYRYVAKGEVKNRRKILLALGIAGAVLGTAYTVSYIGGMAGFTEQMMSSGTQAMEGIAAGGALAGSVLVSLLSSVVSIVTLVFWHISLYDLYTSCNPRNNVVFLVLGIIFSFLTPFFIFANRNRDGGMPPRKQPVPSDIPDARWQPAESPKEPWEMGGEQ